MKRVFISICIVLIICCTCFQSFASDSEKEITFRGIPWGSTYQQAMSQFPGTRFYKNDSISKKADSLGVILNSDSYHVYSHDGLNISAESFSDERVKVAGYEAESTSLYFVYVPSPEGLIRTDNYTALYAAKYYFKTIDLQAMSQDLIEKLTSIYGNYDEEENYTDWFYGTKIRILTWKRSEATLYLKLYDKEISTDSLVLVYYYNKGESMLAEASKAIEQNAYGNGNTDGL